MYGELAQIYYHWHRLERSTQYFERSVQWSLPGGFSDAQIYHSVFLSRLFQMEGRLQESVEEIEKALDLMKTAAPSLVGEEVIAQQVSIFLALDRFAEAQSALQPMDLSLKAAFPIPNLDPTLLSHTHKGCCTTAPCALCCTGSQTGHEQSTLKKGIDLASLVLQGSFRARHLPIALQTLLLRAQLYAAIGEDQVGLADVSRALELAEPEGFISIFLEEGQPVADVLATLLKRRCPAA